MSSNQNILVKLNRAGFSLNNKWLVKGVSLQVEKGKIVTLIGPNGSGKSTTAKIALGIYKKIDGSVEKYTSKVGYVPQKISIDWTLPLRVNDFMVLTESISNELIAASGFSGNKKWYDDTQNQGLPGETGQIYNVRTEIEDNNGQGRKIRGAMNTDITPNKIQTPGTPEITPNFTNDTVLHYLFTHDRRINQ